MLNTLLLQAANTEGNAMYQYVLIGSMLFVFYFFMIRPQQKQKREQRIFLDKIKKGTHVITIGGIHGKVFDVTDDTLTLEIDNKGAKLTVSRGAISLDAVRRYTQKK
ncbi:MAG: preprotein translocase subunit YajC [Bacteroidota bacterium]